MPSRRGLTKAERRNRVERLLKVEDAFDALQESVLDRAGDQRRRRAAMAAENALDRLDRRLEIASTPVDISQAAELLQVSEQTIRDWIKRRILDTVPGRRPAAVTFESVRWARRLLRDLRVQDPDRAWGGELLAAARQERDAFYARV